MTSIMWTALVLGGLANAGGGLNGILKTPNPISLSGTSAFAFVPAQGLQTNPVKQITRDIKCRRWADGWGEAGMSRNLPTFR